jgi:hypothetical protein
VLQTGFSSNVFGGPRDVPTAQRHQQVARKHHAPTATVGEPCML